MTADTGTAPADTTPPADTVVDAVQDVVDELDLQHRADVAALVEVPAGTLLRLRRKLLLTPRRAVSLLAAAGVLAFGVLAIISAALNQNVPHHSLQAAGLVCAGVAVLAALVRVAMAAVAHVARRELRQALGRRRAVRAARRAG
jgi:hypothetical protein